MVATNSSSAPNGTGAHNGTGHGWTNFEAVGHGPTSSSKQSSSERIPDIALSIYEGLYERSKERAILSGDVEPRADELAALTEHAKAMAESVYREAFDPQNRIEHQLRQDEFDDLRRQSAEKQLAVQHIRANVNEWEQRKSKLQAAMSRPTVQTILMLSAVIALAMTIAPTLHDYIFFTITDEILKWVVSFLCSLTYGVFITWGLLDSDDENQRRSVRHWLSLAGGIAVPIGLGLLRVANATGSNEMLFAAALTIVEIGIVLLLDARAVQLRTSYREWAEQHIAIKEAEAQVVAEQNKLVQHQAELNTITGRIETHIRTVEELAVRNLNVDRIKEDAVKAVKDGYYEGLAFNRGRTRGINRRL